MPWATAASNNAMPSVAMAGTATTSSPGRRTRRSASRRRTSGCDSSDRPSRWSRSNARNAAGRPGSPGQPTRQLDRVRPPRGIDHDQLAVQDRRPRGDPDGQPGQLGQHVRQVVAGGIANHDRPVARPSPPARSTRGRVHRPTTARTGARRSRTAPAVGAGASAAGPADRAAGRPRGAARAGRPSWPDGSPLDCPRPDQWRNAVPRAPRPDDLFRLRIATEPRLSPDGSVAVVTVQTVAPGYDGYRRALWLVPTDGSRPPRPADPRRQARPASALLARWPDARLHLGPEAPARRGDRRPGRPRARSARIATRSTSCRSTAARRAG